MPGGTGRHRSHGVPNAARSIDAHDAPDRTTFRE
jgi:hypothetical protein